MHWLKLSTFGFYKPKKKLSKLDAPTSGLRKILFGKEVVQVVLVSSD